MQIVIDIPDYEIPEKQDIISVDIHFIDGEVCECDYGFQVLPKGHGMMKDEICIQDKYDKRILARRYGNVFDCNNCGRSWIACKDDIIEGYELYVKLRCPYCHNMINIPRNFNWF